MGGREAKGWREEAVARAWRLRAGPRRIRTLLLLLLASLLHDVAKSQHSHPFLLQQGSKEAARRGSLALSCSAASGDVDLTRPCGRIHDRSSPSLAYPPFPGC